MRKIRGGQLAVLLPAAIFFSCHSGATPGNSINPNKHPKQTSLIANQLRPFILEMIPEPLFEDSRKWNLQKKDKRGDLKNDGRWIRYKIIANDLKDKMAFQIDNLKKTSNLSTFVIRISFDSRIHLDRQTWKNGIRLYSGTTRARFRIHLKLDCELVSRTIKSDNWLPDLLIQFKIVKSNFHYEDLVVEHTAGLGGDLAKLLGELMIESFKIMKPNFENNLIEKINAAIQKAGSTKEIKIQFSELFSSNSTLLKN